MIVPSRMGIRGKTGGNGKASGVQNCWSEYRMSRESPMVAMTSGSTPVARSRATSNSLTSQPSSSVDTRMVASRARTKGHRSTTRNSTIAKAGRTTNSPWAKLIVFDVCHSSTKPMAVSA